MELHLETAALFSLKLAYESEGSSPILRDDLVMGDYQRDVFELLVKRGDVTGIQVKLGECVGLAMEAVGGVEKPLGRELQRLGAPFRQPEWSALALLQGPEYVTQAHEGCDFRFLHADGSVTPPPSIY